MKGTLCGSAILRIMIFWSLYWGPRIEVPLVIGNLPCMRLLKRITWIPKEHVGGGGGVAGVDKGFPLDHTGGMLDNSNFRTARLHLPAPWGTRMVTPKP